jgi:hypothetical protein
LSLSAASSSPSGPSCLPARAREDAAGGARQRRPAGLRRAYQRTARREGDEAETTTTTMARWRSLLHPHCTGPPVAFSVAARKAIRLVESRQGLPLLLGIKDDWGGNWSIWSDLLGPRV